MIVTPAIAPRGRALRLIHSDCFIISQYSGYAAGGLILALLAFDCSSPAGLPRSWRRKAVRSAAGSTMEIALWSPGRGGRLKSAHQSSTPEAGSCSVLGAQSSKLGRVRFSTCISVPPLTGGLLLRRPQPKRDGAPLLPWP